MKLSEVTASVVQDVVEHLFDPLQTRSARSTKALISPCVAVKFPWLPDPPEMHDRIIADEDGYTISPSYRHSPSAQALSLFRVPALAINYFLDDGCTLEVAEVIQSKKQRNRWIAVLRWTYRSDYFLPILKFLPFVGKKLYKEYYVDRFVEIAFEPLGQDDWNPDARPAFDSSSPDDIEPNVFVTQVTYGGTHTAEALQKLLPDVVRDLPPVNLIWATVERVSPYFLDLWLSPTYGILLLLGLDASTPTLEPSAISQGRRNRRKVKKAKRKIATLHPRREPSHTVPPASSDSEASTAQLSVVFPNVRESNYHYYMRRTQDTIKQAQTHAQILVEPVDRLRKEAGTILHVVEKGVRAGVELGFAVTSCLVNIAGAAIHIASVEGRKLAREEKERKAEERRLAAERRASTVFGRSSTVKSSMSSNANSASSTASKRVSFAGTNDLNIPLVAFAELNRVMNTGPRTPHPTNEVTSLFDLEATDDERHFYTDDHSTSSKRSTRTPWTTPEPTAKTWLSPVTTPFGSLGGSFKRAMAKLVSPAAESEASFPKGTHRRLSEDMFTENASRKKAKFDNTDSDDEDNWRPVRADTPTPPREIFDSFGRLTSLSTPSPRPSIRTAFLDDVEEASESVSVSRRSSIAPSEDSSTGVGHLSIPRLEEMDNISLLYPKDSVPPSPAIPHQDSNETVDLEDGDFFSRPRQESSASSGGFSFSTGASSDFLMTPADSPVAQRTGKSLANVDDDLPSMPDFSDLKTPTQGDFVSPFNGSAIDIPKENAKSVKKDPGPGFGFGGQVGPGGDGSDTPRPASRVSSFSKATGHLVGKSKAADPIVSKNDEDSKGQSAISSLFEKDEPDASGSSQFLKGETSAGEATVTEGRDSPAKKKKQKKKKNRKAGQAVQHLAEA